jgi:hypothetical protein
VIDRLRITRWAVVGGVLLAVGVAGATTKLKRASDGDACLCTPEAQPTDLTTAIDPARASGSFMARSGGTAIPTNGGTAGSLAPIPMTGTAEYSGGGAGLAGGAPAVVFGSGGRSIGAYSASSHGDRGMSLGGLWRLMSLSHRSARAEAVHAAVRTAVERTPRTPNRGGSGRGPGSGHGSSGGGTGPGATIAAPVQLIANANPFDEHTTPISNLLNGGGSSAPNLGGIGGPSNHHPSPVDPGKLSATPEPASLLLFGTGLFGAFTLVRRRTQQQ